MKDRAIIAPLHKLTLTSEKLPGDVKVYHGYDFVKVEPEGGL